MSINDHELVYASQKDALTSVPWREGCKQCEDLQDTIIENGTMATVVVAAYDHFSAVHRVILMNPRRKRSAS
jgi:hypothetical protein